MSKNAPIRARLFIGGLKSLFIDMATTIEEIEKTGQMPIDLLESFEDVKTAIDMAVLQLVKTSEMSRCCSHAPEVHHEEDECEVCGLSEDDCECEEEETCDDCGDFVQECSCDEEEEEPPPPPPSKAKKSEAKVVIPAKKKGK